MGLRTGVGRWRRRPRWRGFAAAGQALSATAERTGPFDAVVVALAGAPAVGRRGGGLGSDVLAAHAPSRLGSVPTPRGHAATADYSASKDRPLRLVTLIDATNAGGRSRAQASAQLSRAARSATKGRVAAFAVSWKGTASDDVGRRASSASWSLTSSARRRPSALSGAELAVGDGWFGLRSHPRPLGSISFGGPNAPELVRRRAGRSWRRSLQADPRGWTLEAGAAVTRRPTRIVDAHVHLWDPARTDWYPYLSGRRQLDMGDVTGMARRFDVATYLAESEGWNVEKMVNVAAATGCHSIDETLELDRRAEVDGHPDAIVGGLPPTDSIGCGSSSCSTGRWAPPDSGASARWGRRRRGSPARGASCHGRSGAWCSSSWPIPISSTRLPEVWPASMG